MSTIQKVISPILESLGPEVMSPNLTNAGDQLYKLFDEMAGDYEVFNKKK